MPQIDTNHPEWANIVMRVWERSMKKKQSTIDATGHSPSGSAASAAKEMFGQKHNKYGSKFGGLNRRQISHYRKLRKAGLDVVDYMNQRLADEEAGLKLSEHEYEGNSRTDLKVAMSAIIVGYNDDEILRGLEATSKNVIESQDGRVQWRGETGTIIEYLEDRLEIAHKYVVAQEKEEAKKEGRELDLAKLEQRDTDRIVRKLEREAQREREAHQLELLHEAQEKEREKEEKARKEHEAQKEKERIAKEAVKRARNTGRHRKKRLHDKLVDNERAQARKNPGRGPDDSTPTFKPRM